MEGFCRIRRMAKGLARRSLCSAGGIQILLSCGPLSCLWRLVRYCTTLDTGKKVPTSRVNCPTLIVGPSLRVLLRDRALSEGPTISSSF